MNDAKIRDVILLGSSTAMQVRTKNASKYGNYFLNHSVSSSTLEDYIGVVGLYWHERNYIPNTVVLGISETFFIDDFTNDRYSSIRQHVKLQLDTMEIILVDQMKLSLKSLVIQVCFMQK